MPSRLRGTRLSLISLASLILTLSACVTIQDANVCAAAGTLSAGGICAHMISPETRALSFSETIDLIEAQPARHCVPVGHWDQGKPPHWVKDLSVCADDQSTGEAMDLPARGAAIIMPAEDWGEKKTELEEACRLLGSRCRIKFQKQMTGGPLELR